MEFQELVEVLPKPTKQWTNDDVVKFLEVMELTAVIPKFRALNIQGKDFPKLNRQFVTNQLQVVSLGYLKKLVGWLEYGREEFDSQLEEYIEENALRKKKEVKDKKQQNNKLEDNKQNQKLKQKQKDIQKQKPKEMLKQMQKQQQTDKMKDNPLEVQIQKVKHTQEANYSDMKFIESDLYLVSKKQLKSKHPLKLIITVDKIEHTVKDLLRIGRQPQNQIVISHDSASRFHAQFRKQDDQYFVKDLSRYGTYVKMAQKQIIEKQSIQILVGVTNIILKPQKIDKLQFDIKLQIPEHKINVLYSNRLSLVIGKKSKDVKIDDPTMANQHVNIYASDGQFVIQSMEAVSYKKIPYSTDVRVEDGNVFRIATTLLYCKLVRSDETYSDTEYEDEEWRQT